MTFPIVRQLEKGPARILIRAQALKAESTLPHQARVQEAVLQCIPLFS